MKRLAKFIVEKLQEAGGVSWREEYDVLMRYGLEQEDGDHCQAESAAEWKRRVRELNGNEWKRRVRELNGNEWKRRVRELTGNEWKEEV